MLCLNSIVYQHVLCLILTHWALSVRLKNNILYVITLIIIKLDKRLFKESTVILYELKSLKSMTIP